MNPQKQLDKVNQQRAALEKKCDALMLEIHNGKFESGKRLRAVEAKLTALNSRADDLQHAINLEY